MKELDTLLTVQSPWSKNQTGKSSCLLLQSVSLKQNMFPLQSDASRICPFGIPLISYNFESDAISSKLKKSCTSEISTPKSQIFVNTFGV